MNTKESWITTYHSVFMTESSKSAEAELSYLTFGQVYEYNGDNEKSHPATMLFEELITKNEVFDSELGYGSFTGTRYIMRICR